ncbi:hypothetical protein B296_00056701 [Ensete ventricosum]|uniref:Uncharacterized protein n=1 Tax=Ensete ventricosum TaxID=4639 RepID=A0A426XIK4_ENSVE|nr:hypothetical protein B296_00056701 [Ensete ventricosum]
MEGTEKKNGLLTWAETEEQEEGRCRSLPSDEALDWSVSRPRLISNKRARDFRQRLKPSKFSEEESAGYVSIEAKYKVEDMGEEGNLLEGDGEGDPATLLGGFDHLLRDVPPRTAHGGARQHVPPRRPPHLALLHPPDDVQQQLRRQVRPPPLLLLRLRLRSTGPLMPSISMAVPVHHPFGGGGSTCYAAASSPGRAPHSVPHLLQLADEALKRHFAHPFFVRHGSEGMGDCCRIRRDRAKLESKGSSWHLNRINQRRSL